MKIKLIDKDNPIPSNRMICFNNRGYDSEIIKKINSGIQVNVDKCPKLSLEYVKKVKKGDK